jgi:hypothetical protein
VTLALFLAVAFAIVAQEAWAQARPTATGALHAEIRDTSVDALPDARVPVSPDLVLAVVDVGTADVAFKFRFRPGSFDPSTTRLAVDLDLDQNSASGTAGVECSVFVHPARGQADVMRNIRPDAPPAGGGTIPVGCAADGCDVNIPRVLLGDDDGRFNFRVRVFSEPAQTTVIDVLPDIGMVRME